MKGKEKKFTPGPWRVEHSNSQMSSGDTTVCVLSYNEILNGFHWVASPAKRHGDEAATARLIAASPEMYEWLKRIADAGEATYGQTKDIQKLLNRITTAQASVATKMSKEQNDGQQ